MSRDCMIFAAGFGTRMGDLTQSAPKPLLQLRGRALIDRAVEIAANHGTIVVSAHYLGEQIEAHFAGTDIRISMEQERILDTGGGLVNARHMLKGPSVFTLNSDALWGRTNPLDHLAQAWDVAHMDALLLIGKPPTINTNATHADFAMGAGGQISRGGDFDQGGVYLGAQILRLSVLDGYRREPFSLNQVWDDLIARERAYGLIYPDAWMDVGTAEAFARAEDFETTP